MHSFTRKRIMIIQQRELPIKGEKFKPRENAQHVKGEIKIYKETLFKTITKGNVIPDNRLNLH